MVGLHERAGHVRRYFVEHNPQPATPTPATIPQRLNPLQMAFLERDIAHNEMRHTGTPTVNPIFSAGTLLEGCLTNSGSHLPSSLSYSEYLSRATHIGSPTFVPDNVSRRKNPLPYTSQQSGAVVPNTTPTPTQPSPTPSTNPPANDSYVRTPPLSQSAQASKLSDRVKDDNVQPNASLFFDAGSVRCFCSLCRQTLPCLS